MALTLVQRVQSITANEGDDFFNVDTIVYFLNQAQNYVINVATQKERESKKSLRVLDIVRRKDTIAAASFNPTLALYGSYTDVYTAGVVFPANLSDVLYIRYKSKTVLRELASNKLHLLDWGNVKPSTLEGYYYVSNNGTNKIFTIYVNDNVSGSADVFYTIKPTALTSTDESLVSLPDFATNAVIYYAASMMAVQEQRQNAGALETLSQKELQTILM